MKANELMIGDYVTFADCQNDKYPATIKIWQINEAGESFASIDGSKALDEIAIDDEIVGIPITPEILEKNEWRRFNTYDKYTHPLAPFEIRHQKDGSYAIEVDADEYGIATVLFIYHVHELQHVLRLCGIEKEIEL